MKFAPLFSLIALASTAIANEPSWLTFEGKNGPGKGKHIVLLSGDEEYRSEEALPQLASILSERHGFKCTVLFAINPKTGEVDPKTLNNVPGLAALDSANLCVLLWRFQQLPDDQMKHFVDYLHSGKPIIGLRTATHAFQYDKNSKSIYKKFSRKNEGENWPGGFGRQVLGETWVDHHGSHGEQATRGIIEASAKQHPILRGVDDIFGNSDVYKANPAQDSSILVRGQILTGLNPHDPPVEGEKNSPMQPIVWTREYSNEKDLKNKVLTITMGAATDFQSEGLRRLFVNGVYWACGLEDQIPSKADVTVVGEYKPAMYGKDGFRRGMKPKAFAP